MSRASTPLQDRVARAWEHFACGNELIVPTPALPYDDQGAHDKLGSRPTVFADGHAEAMRALPADWTSTRHAYSPSGASGAAVELYDAAVKHLLWFISSGSYRAGGGDD